MTPIDVDTWPRRRHFEHYFRAAPCTFAITVEVDVTDLNRVLRESSRKTYVAQIWALATVVNRRHEFRMALTDDGRPATWDVVHPAFTIFNAQRETFSCVWTAFDPDFATFHDGAANLIATHQASEELFPQDDLPPDLFDVSSLPWAEFSAFSIQTRGGFEHLLPIFTLGRFREREGRTLLPVAVQIHHAAADGFHVARLVSDLQALVGEPDWVG